MAANSTAKQPSHRISFAKLREPLQAPNLLGLQVESFDWLLGNDAWKARVEAAQASGRNDVPDVSGLEEIFHEISPIEDVAGTMSLSFHDHRLESPKYSMEEAKAKDYTYSAPMYVTAEFMNYETGEIKSQTVFMGDFPLMTPRGTFIINGTERVVVSQLVRSPGVYFEKLSDRSTDKETFGAKIIPSRGAWLEFEIDKRDAVGVRIDRKRKQSVTHFLKAIGMTESEIRDTFAAYPVLLETLEKDTVGTQEEALLDIYRKLRPGEPANVDAAQTLLNNFYFDSRRYDLAKVGRYKINKKLAIEADPKASTLSLEDIVATVKYLLALHQGDKTFAGTRNGEPVEVRVEVDDIDNFANRRIRAVGELIQGQVRTGLARMERTVRERMTTQETDSITPQTLINIRPVVAAIKEFFGTSQLSQFMDQNNPLAELTHKRRLSALGPGGLSRERAGYEVRDVHNSHYGRMCPIETPEGPNIGLIGSLSTFAVINRYGFMETPYRKVDKANKRVTDEVVYMTADEEDKYIVAQANEPLDEEGYFLGERVTARAKDDVLSITPDKVDLMDVSPKQVVSIATALIPFLENDDANRALMGANMQRQAVPLLCTQAPIIGTGMEYKVAVDSGVCVLAKRAGEVIRVVGNEIRVRAENGEVDVYPLLKFKRSNQGTCVNQRPIVFKGDKVVEKQVLADGPATDHGELALGHNVIIAYMPWEGYNYEDAVLLNEDLVKADIFTSIHIEEYDCDARDTKLGKEEITREIPNVSEDALKDLDERGIIRIGAEVRPGDILVGKVTPKGETELTAEERLLRAIFGEKAREVRDSSLRVPHGEAGKIVSVKVFSRENGDDLPPGVNEQVRVHIAQKRKISEGDKMAGRHGNKGVVSRIMAREDMPFLPTGEPVHIVLNPLGVPSRMNIGQVLENHLGWAARALGMEIDTTNLMSKLAAAEKSGAAEGTPEFEAAYREELANSETAKKLEKYGYNYEKYGMPETVEIDKFGGKSVKAVQISVPVFDGAHEQDIADALELAGIDKTAKTVLYDGRTGEPFDNPVTVGLTYYLKLHHLVDDKIHARSTGPYSLVTQQPLGGKAQFGGQRFGEMEVWALEAYGAAYTLQEILTVKSDDVVGRVKTYEAIVKGENVPDPGIPESFKVLVKELQSIGLDIKVLNEDEEEVSLRDDEDEDIATTAREVDLDINGQVQENAPEQPVDDYADNDATEDNTDDVIADLGNGMSVNDGADSDLNDPENM